MIKTQRHIHISVQGGAVEYQVYRNHVDVDVVDGVTNIGYLDKPTIESTRAGLRIGRSLAAEIQRVLDAGAKHVWLDGDADADPIEWLRYLLSFGTRPTEERGVA